MGNHTTNWGELHNYCRHKSFHLLSRMCTWQWQWLSQQRECRDCKFLFLFRFNRKFFFIPWSQLHLFPQFTLISTTWYHWSYIITCQGLCMDFIAGHDLLCDDILDNPLSLLKMTYTLSIIRFLQILVMQKPVYTHKAFLQNPSFCPRV